MKFLIKLDFLWQSLLLRIYVAVYSRNFKFIKLFRCKFDSKLLKLVSEAIEKTHENISHRGFEIQNWIIIDKNQDSPKPSIALASQEQEYEHIDFNATFNDPEDSMALHRFNWALFSLESEKTTGRVKDILSLIERWINTDKAALKHSAFGAYTISERIIAWSYITIIAESLNLIRSELLDKIYASVNEQLSILLSELEYHNKYTNNHILNNARALFVAGTVFGNNKAVKVGEYILKKETSDMIINGVLNEDSTNYQILLTKNYIEVFNVAVRSGNETFAGFMAPYIAEMLKVCRALQGPGGFYPFIGDISPDCAPSWTAGYPFTSDKITVSKWFNLINPVLPDYTDSVNINKSGNINWLLLENDGFKVTIVAKNGIKCHGHNDNGSISVFNGKDEYIIDPGLYGYDLSNPFAAKQISSRGHNTPIINNTCADIERGALFTPTGFRSNFKLVESGANSLKYRINYYDRSVSLNRSITIENAALKICDTVFLKGSADEYECNWLLPDKFKDNFDFILTNQGFKITDNKFFFSKKYGILDECRIISISGKIKSGESVELILRPNRK